MNETQEELDQIQEFLIKDKISLVKLRANREIMRNESLEIYKAYVRLHSVQDSNTEDLSRDITPTIEWMADILNQPLGYPVWFMSAYPDVVFWASKLAEKSTEENIWPIIGNFSEKDVSANGKMNISFLRKIVDAYVNNGNILEVV